MSLKMELTSLVSRAIREKIPERIIKPLETTQFVKEGEQNILKIIWNGAIGFGGFIVAAVKALLTLDMSKIWSLIVSAVTFIWNFNWQATDENLDAAIQSKLDAIAGLAGATLGNAFGYVACGLLPGIAVLAFNEPLGAKILLNVAQEGVDEFIDNLAGLCKYAFNIGMQVLITWLFKNTRKILKSNSKVIGALFGSKAESIIKGWGEKGSQPWSFASAFENVIESIPNQALRNFVEEFAEEAIEACVEAGYVVANTIDAHIAQKAVEQEVFPPGGQMRYVELTPNRQYPDQKILIGGKEDSLEPMIVQTLVNNRLLGDRDVGVIYGTDNQQPVRSIKPEVVFKFYEEKKDRLFKNAAGETVARSNPVTMQISFRLMNKDETNFTDKTYAKELALKIMSKFGKPPFKISKGNQLYTYHDWAKGYSLNLWTTSQADARKIVEQVLDIQGHTVDDDLLRVGSKPINGIKTKEKKTVFGKVEEIPLPGNKTGLVTFRTAHLNIGNGTKPVWLVDLTGKKRDVVFDSI